jgi:hypothetical protein
MQPAIAKKSTQMLREKATLFGETEIMNFIKFLIN